MVLSMVPFFSVFPKSPIGSSPHGCSAAPSPGYQSNLSDLSSWLFLWLLLLLATVPTVHPGYSSSFFILISHGYSSTLLALPRPQLAHILPGSTSTSASSSGSSFGSTSHLLTIWPSSSSRPFIHIWLLLYLGPCSFSSSSTSGSSSHS